MAGLPAAESPPVSLVDQSGGPQLNPPEAGESAIIPADKSASLVFYEKFHPDGISTTTSFHRAPITGSTLRFDRRGEPQLNESKKAFNGVDTFR